MDAPGTPPAQVVINVGGEGEVPGAVNVNGDWLQSPNWRASRDGNLTLGDLRAAGHQFVFAPMDRLPFADASVDVVYTNNIRIGGRSPLGPYPTETEIWRVLKPGGAWFHDGVAQRRP